MRIRGERLGRAPGIVRGVGAGVLLGTVFGMATAFAAPQSESAPSGGPAPPTAAPATEPTHLPGSPKASEPDLGPVFHGRPALTLEELRAFEAHTHELTQSLKKYVVGVQVGPAQGSGVVVSADGFVLTAAHVNGDDGRSVVFIFPDGSTRKGKTLGLNHGVDAGMMKIDLKEGETLPYVEMGKSDDLDAGQWCVALGHPGGYQEGRQPVLRVGRIISHGPTTIRTDCTLVGGDSGGPLFDMDGKLIGIHSRIGMSLSANLHVPVATYQDTWDRLAKGDNWRDGRAPRPYVGFKANDTDGGVVIDGVVEGAPAAKAGLKVGDVLLRFDGKKVGSLDELRSFLERAKAGDKVNVDIRRGDGPVTLTLVIEAKD